MGELFNFPILTNISTNFFLARLVLVPDEYFHVHFLFLFSVKAVWDAAKKLFKLKAGVWSFLTEVVPQHLDRFLA